MKPHAFDADADEIKIQFGRNELDGIEDIKVIDDGHGMHQDEIQEDFGALGATKHFADVVLALYREEMYDSASGIQGATELLVRKNRNGSIGYVDLYFYAQWMRFEDMLDPDR